MLDEEQMKEIKSEFLGAIGSIDRDGFDLEGLTFYLESIGFFESPATSKENCSFPGGLCLHSLNVYNELKSINESSCDVCYNDETVLIVGLLSSVGKAGLYEKYCKNEKVYSPNGSKKDDLGNFDWVSSFAYGVVDHKKRSVYGDSGFASYFAISAFLPLTDQETIAIVNQWPLFGEASIGVREAVSQSPLAGMLHAAQVIASLVVER